MYELRDSLKLETNTKEEIESRYEKLSLKIKTDVEIYETKITKSATTISRLEDDLLKCRVRIKELEKTIDEM